MKKSPIFNKLQIYIAIAKILARLWPAHLKKVGQ